jgi:nucleoside-diphosphate-sugar epimerase
MDEVVVIGGSGFIGRHLTKQLLDAGSSVTVVGRSAGLHAAQHSALRYVRSNVADADEIADAIEGASVVYDLSMSPSTRWADYQRNYIEGAWNVARACQKHRVRRLIYASSIAALYLGARRRLTEADGPDPKAAGRSFYSRAKIAAEQLLMNLHRTEKLPAVILRPAIVLGPGGMLAHGALGMAFSDTCILGWGRGNNPLPCVLARDVARAMILAKDAPGIEGMAFNLAGDIRPTAEEFVRILRERTLRNFRFYPRNVWAMGASDFLIAMLKVLLRKSGDPENNNRNSFRDLRSLTMASDLDCSAARKLLGWQPETGRDVFFREAIDVHLKPFDPGDLRLERAQN